jgi:hypothetical protein
MHLPGVRHDARRRCVGRRFARGGDMTEQELPRAAVAVAPGAVTTDLPCRRCQYNLRGLPLDGRWPECGTPVAASTRGDLLRHADPQWLDRLRRGTAWQLWAVAVLIGGGIVGVLIAGAGATSLASILISLVGNGLYVAGVWMQTTPDPGGSGEARNGPLRRLIRVALVIGLSEQLAGVAMQVGAVSPAVLVLLLVGAFVGAVADLVVFFAMLVYYVRLAERMPDAFLAGRARFLIRANAYLVGVLIVGLLVTGLCILAGGQTLAPYILTVAGCVGLLWGLAGLGLAILFLRLVYQMGEQIGREAYAAQAAEVPTSVCQSCGRRFTARSSAGSADPPCPHCERAAAGPPVPWLRRSLMAAALAGALLIGAGVFLWASSQRPPTAPPTQARNLFLLPATPTPPLVQAPVPLNSAVQPSLPLPPIVPPSPVQPLVATRLITASDEFVADVYVNGRPVPQGNRHLLAEVYGAQAERVTVELREGDWVVFHVVNKGLRWDGQSYFGTAALTTDGRVVFTTERRSSRWSACDDPSAVPAFLADPTAGANVPAVAPEHVWTLGDGMLRDYVPRWAGQPIWGRSHSTWLKCTIAAGRG